MSLTPSNGGPLPTCAAEHAVKPRLCGLNHPWIVSLTERLSLRRRTLFCPTPTIKAYILGRQTTLFPLCATHPPRPVALTLSRADASFLRLPRAADFLCLLLLCYYGFCCFSLIDFSIFWRSTTLAYVFILFDSSVCSVYPTLSFLLFFADERTK